MNLSFKCSFRELTPIWVYTVPQSRTERRKWLKFHIQSRFLYKKIICTRETCIICMNVRCMYKKFTNIFRWRYSVHKKAKLCLKRNVKKLKDKLCSNENRLSLSCRQKKTECSKISKLSVYESKYVHRANWILVHGFFVKNASKLNSTTLI